ncbi:hypothetical protein K8R33_02060 [archaeon]|nr:hypothetical protein [archaeon]
MDTIEQDYNNLIKQYKLPSFTKLDEEFEIRALEENRSGRPVKAIIRVIAGKLRSFLEALDAVVNPNPGSVYSMITVNGLDNPTKEKIFQFYKKVASLYQQCLLFELLSDEESANFIKKFWKEWPTIKKKQIEHLKQIINAWAKETKKESKLGYHG